MAPGDSPSAIQFGGITDVNTDAAGNVYFTDCAGGHAYEFTPGVGTTDLGAFSCPVGIATDNSGNRLIGSGQSLYMVPAGGGSASILETGTSIGSVAVGGAGNIWMADGSNHLAVMIGGTLAPIRVAGTGYDGNINSLRLDGAGNFFASVAFFGGAIELPVGGGSATTIGTGLGYSHGVATDGAGTVWINDVNNGTIQKVTGGVQTQVGSGFDNLYGLATWPPHSVVARASSSIGLTGLPISPVNTVTPVKLKATAAAASGSKVGLVQFSSYGQPLANAVMSNSLGIATLTTALPAGTDSVVATFLGNAANYASQSSALSYVVNQLASHTVLTTPGSTTVPGDAPVSVTATVTGSHSTIPTGNVEFRVNNVTVDNVSVDSTGVATASINLKPGMPKVTAVYDGDAIFKTSKSNTITFTTTVQYTPSISTSVSYGAPNINNAVRATITVTVMGVTGNGAPTGTIIADHGFTCTVLTQVLTSVKSKAKCSHLLPFGTSETVLITYSGDGTYDGATASPSVDNSGG